MTTTKLAFYLICALSFLSACGGGGGTETITPEPFVMNAAPPAECSGPYPFDIFSHTSSERPVIALNGDSIIQLQIGDIYQDQGASASDKIEGDISAGIEVFGLDNFDSSQIGDYLIRYNIKNSENVAAKEVVRIVRVNDSENYTIQTKRKIGNVSAVYGYFEHLPSGYSHDEPLPLIIYNHGIGEAANFDQVDSDEFANSGDLLDRLLRRGFPGMMNTDNWDKSRQFIALSPQRCLDGVVNEALRVNDFMQYALQTYNVDPKRVYMVGFSAGAFVTWVHEAIFPGEVAALTTIAGGTRDLDDTCSVKDVPSWIFHAEDDGTVSPEISKDMIAMLNDCPVAPLVRPKLTLFPDGGHLIDVSTLDLTRLNTGNAIYDIYDQSIYDWLLSYTLP